MHTTNKIPSSPGVYLQLFWGTVGRRHLRQSPEGGMWHLSIGHQHLGFGHHGEPGRLGADLGVRVGSVHPAQPTPPPPPLGQGQQGPRREPALPWAAPSGTAWSGVKGQMAGETGGLGEQDAPAATWHCTCCYSHWEWGGSEAGPWVPVRDQLGPGPRPGHWVWCQIPPGPAQSVTHALVVLGSSHRPSHHITLLLLGLHQLLQDSVVHLTFCSPCLTILAV